MHLDLGELGENVGYVLELRPVELQVLPRREVAVAAVVRAGDVGEGAQLRGREEPVRNRDPQHRRVPLDVEPIAQTQRPELVFAELAGKEPPRLVAELLDPAGHELAVVIVVAVHGAESLMSKAAAYRPRTIIGKNIKS